MKRTSVSIITPNFNGEKYLKNYFHSLLKSKFSAFEIIIVDDGSTDRSIKIIKAFQRTDNRVRLFRNKANMGASASRNVALKQAKGEIVVFLDNDTEVDPYWLNHILVPFDKDKRIGGVQAVLLDINRRDLIQMAGGHFIKEVGWIYPFYQWQSYSKKVKRMKTRSIIAISAALAVRKSVAMQIDGFDEKEAVTTEDLDFCWRIWMTGYKIVIAPKSVVFHWTKDLEERVNLKVKKQSIYYHLAKNSFRSILKNYQFPNYVYYLITSFMVNWGRAFYYLLKGDISALLGVARGTYWFIYNMGDTLKQRKIIQKFRKTNDSELFREVFSTESAFAIFLKFLKPQKI